MITGILIGAVCGFIGGLLFGRRNSKKVEVGVEEAKTILRKAGVKI